MMGRKNRKGLFVKSPCRPIRPKLGRGIGNEEELIEEFASQRDEIKCSIDQQNQEIQEEFVASLNEFQNNLGTSFMQGKMMFEMETTNMTKHAEFLALLKELGFDIGMD